MHIPDGFLSPPVWASLDVLSFPAVGWMAKRAQRETLSDGLGDRRIPLLGVMGAFVFAAQMINFPLGMGTSGHLVGGALLSVVLGPASAAIVMTAILVIQAFVFQDGGIMALGANILNMAIIGVLAGYLPFRLWGAAWRNAALFCGGVLSVLCSACMALSQLALSGVPVRGRILWISLALFLAAAIAEGAITLAALNAIERLNPRWVRSPAGSGSRTIGALAIASVVMIVIGVLFASTAPDGIQSLLAGSGVPAEIDSVWQHRVSAAFTGIALLYGACLLTGRLLARRSA